MAEFTPMMEQYLKIKEDYKYCLVFFRLGDFYELFFDDALIASRELKLTLTGRDCGREERAPMCGVPYHAAEGYIAKLVAKGYKVAICEQMEPPGQSKVVKREVIRVVTPGTVTDEKILDGSKNNYIVSIYCGREGIGFAAADVSTGEFYMTNLPPGDSSKLIDETAGYNPSEIIYGGDFAWEESLEAVFHIKPTPCDLWMFEGKGAEKRLCAHFGVMNLSGFGLDGSPSVSAGGALLQYLMDTQKNSLSHITTIKPYKREDFLILDVSSRRNLELTETLREKNRKGSLLWVMDKTQTAMGARLLRKWIEQPLVNPEDINARLDGVEDYKNDPLSREELKESLKTVYDIERLMGKVIYGTANARDLVALKNSFRYLPGIKNLLLAFKSSVNSYFQQELDSLPDLYQLIDQALLDEPPHSIREGGIIKDGYNEELDQYRLAKNQGANWLLNLEAREREATGIKNLKVRYNKVFGYYIEITNSYLNLVPERYIRRQTLSNCERFTTKELKEIEDRILGADAEIVEIEYKLFTDIRNKLAGEVKRIQGSSNIIAAVDALCSLGEIADLNGYVRPLMDRSGLIEIKDGRHPVVEKLGTESFIPNDTCMDTESYRLSIITGPNMAGKSTFMRQTALITLMAQAGSFVPAKSARIGVADRIFTRVGASDDLATGQSTFMVEMSEVANILNNATKNSLVILDEIGRGTSTFDGLSIAWGVLEYIASKEKIGARTLFATHYHELTELEGRVDGVVNYCFTVQEQGSSIIFLRKIIRGEAGSSYGVEVARLAGIPGEIINRSREILGALNDADIAKNTRVGTSSSETVYYGKKRKDDSKNKRIIINELEDEINKLDLDSMAPIEAWNHLKRFKEVIKEVYEKEGNH